MKDNATYRSKDVLEKLYGLQQKINQLKKDKDDYDWNPDDRGRYKDKYDYVKVAAELLAPKRRRKIKITKEAAQARALKAWETRRKGMNDRAIEKERERGRKRIEDDKRRAARDAAKAKAKAEKEAAKAKALEAARMAEERAFAHPLSIKRVPITMHQGGHKK